MTQTNEIAIKDKSIKKLIDKIKHGKPTNITYECLRVALRSHGIITTEKELKNILKVKA
jgi:hypothetical protein